MIFVHSLIEGTVQQNMATFMLLEDHSSAPCFSLNPDVVVAILLQLVEPFVICKKLF